MKLIQADLSIQLFNQFLLNLPAKNKKNKCKKGGIEARNLSNFKVIK